VVDDVDLVAFDLDDTLTPSKSAIPEPMAAALTRLLELRPVCIITGGQLSQITGQVVDHLPADVRSALHLMPTCGTRYYRVEDGEVREIYAHELPQHQRDRAAGALEREARRLGLWEAQPWGQIIEDRGSQVTFSALGQHAPVAAKAAWDPDGRKREALRRAVAREVPDLEVRSGGSTSIDVTALGIDKAFGMKQLAEHTGVALARMLFVGDRLDEGGNDYPVKALGVPTVAVSGWEDAVAVVHDLADRFAAGAAGDDVEARAAQPVAPRQRP